MTSEQLEQLFFRPAPETTVERAERKRQSSDLFRPVTVNSKLMPYHLELGSVLPTRTLAIQESGQIVFHVVGDTGGVNGTGAQQNVADHMSRQIHESSMPDQPSFFYHLGDVVYNHGEGSGYHDQFYQPYQDYPAPIFAIPGNHDGNSLDSQDTLAAFREHFCAAEPASAPEAGHSDRPTMIQPNPYWQLNSPFVTIIGLYSNVSGELDNTDRNETKQRYWLTEQLANAPRGKFLLLTVHHPLYSLGKHGGTVRVREAIEKAISVSGRWPDAILTGHDHCYQRFTLKRHGRQIPVLIVGAGGFAGYDDLTRVKTQLKTPSHVELEAYNDRRPGFMRITATTKELTGEYFTVPKPGCERKPAKLRDRFILSLKEHRLQ